MIFEEEMSFVSVLKEFKEFAMRGSVVDLAVGIIIGAAFSQIADSLVTDILTPPIGLMLGGVDFSSLALIIKEGENAEPSVSIRYGVFLNHVINFLIISWAVFILVKGMNSWRRREKENRKTIKCPECQMEIPDNAKKCGHCWSEFKKAVF